MFRRARFELPPPAFAIPANARDLVRLVDPTGIAIAWLAVHEARVLGLAVRDDARRWHQLIVPPGSIRPLVGGAEASWQLIARDPTAAWLHHHDATLHLALENGALVMTIEAGTTMAWDVTAPLADETHLAHDATSLILRLQGTSDDS